MRPLAVLAVALWPVAHAAGAATFDEAMQAYRAHQPDRALSMFRDLADAGDTAAQTNLGVLLARGIGAPQSEAGALYWLWRAALAGEVRAAEMAGYLETRMPDAARTEVLDRLAADLETEARAGTLGALSALGRLEAGLRRPADPAAAYRWFALAAAFGSADAGAAREIVARGMAAPDRLAAQESVGGMFDDICKSLEAGKPASCP